MDWLIKHKLAALAIIIVLAGMTWYLLSDSSSPDAVLSSEGSSKIPPDAQQLVQTLSTLRGVSLSGTIFSNPSFAALQDFTKPVVPEPVGRENPFLPPSGN